MTKHPLWDCTRCQDWGTLVPGDNTRTRTVDPSTIGQGTEFCDCPKGRDLAAAARGGKAGA